VSVRATRIRVSVAAGLGLLLGVQTAAAQPEESPVAVPTAAGSATEEPSAPEPPAANEPRNGPRAARNVTVVAPEGHPTLPLLRAELEALGLRVHEVRPDAPAPSSDFRVVLSEGHIEVWVFDRGTGQLTMREVFTQPGGTAVESLTAVLHAVELLRWQLQAPPPEPAPEPPPPPKPAPPPPPDRSGWLLSAMAQAVISPGGTTAGAGTELDVTRYWSDVGIRVFAAATLLPNRYSSSEGEAEATSHFGGVQGVLIATGDESPIVANIGAGVALVSTHLTATAESGYRAQDDHLLTVSPVFDLRAGVPLGQTAALMASATMLAPLRSDRLVFANRTVARHGELFVTGGLGVQVTLH